MKNTYRKIPKPILFFMSDLNGLSKNGLQRNYIVNEAHNN